ncbi:MAG: hypothetical protein J6H21_02360 [Firmicutes bacterium]|nr:hypothetical protein [Bacillota bacterium]
MKRTIVVLLIALLAIGLAGCSSSKSTDKLETIADAMALEVDNRMSSYDENHFVLVYTKDGNPTRVIADMTPEKYEALGDINFFDETGDISKELNEFMAGLRITKVEDLSQQILPQEELDKLIGLTGEEVLAQDYEIYGHEFTMESTKFSLTKDMFVYAGTFDGIIDEKQYEDPDEELIKDLVLTAIEYEDVSYAATELE